MSEPIIMIDAKSVNHSYATAEGGMRSVLENVNVKLYENEIVALLGKSGSGKSTLLRIIAGLTLPTSGEVLYRGKNIEGPVQGISMVFQSFALMPWLTVLQNVELGLEALGVNMIDRRKRALNAIDTIGLDGFESAYPRELSGGMRQRVGFARALVVNPDLLLMDEPFSALDVLTADNLRSDLLRLWQEKKTNTKGMLFVTHNIEEAVLVADRVLVMGSNPGNIRAELKLDLPHPREEGTPVFNKYVDHIYTLMTTRSDEVNVQTRLRRAKGGGLGYHLPAVTVSELIGLLETMSNHDNSKIDLPELAEEWHLDIDDLFPLLEALELLEFATVSRGDVEITESGKQFATADILKRKEIFSEHLKRGVPLIQHICRVLDERPGHKASEERFLTRLEDYFSEKEAEQVLSTAIDWGRYAEVFAYDYNTGLLSLENPS
jgi:NitT/TauT family transport system ATP-binding protein